MFRSHDGEVRFHLIEGLNCYSFEKCITLNFSCMFIVRFDRL